jgi:hypothetical protein
MRVTDYKESIQDSMHSSSLPPSLLLAQPLLLVRGATYCDVCPIRWSPKHLRTRARRGRSRASLVQGEMSNQGARGGARRTSLQQAGDAIVGCQKFCPQCFELMTLVSRNTASIINKGRAFRRVVTLFENLTDLVREYDRWAAIADEGLDNEDHPFPHSPGYMLLARLLNNTDHA